MKQTGKFIGVFLAGAIAGLAVFALTGQGDQPKGEPIQAEQLPGMYYTESEANQLMGFAFETGFTQGYRAAAFIKYPTFEAFEKGLAEHRDQYLTELDAIPGK